MFRKSRQGRQDRRNKSRSLRRDRPGRRRGSALERLEDRALLSAVHLDLRLDAQAKTWEVLASSTTGDNTGLAGFAIDVVGSGGLTVQSAAFGAPGNFVRFSENVPSVGQNIVGLQDSANAIQGLGQTVGSPVRIASGTYAGFGGTLNVNAQSGGASVLPVGWTPGTNPVLADFFFGDTEAVIPLLGDANRNGLVNGADFIAVQVQLNASGSAGIAGDADLNGVVNDIDFTSVLNNLAAVQQTNSAPQVTSQTVSLVENSAAGVIVTTVAATDVDVPAQTLSFAITSGNTSGAFAINSSTGVITVANSAALDVETNASFQLVVTATDNATSALAGQGGIQINLTQVNDPPVVSAQSFSVDENSAVGTVVGTVAATDPDVPAQTLNFSITGGNTAGAFGINFTTGQITVINSAPLNFEATTSFALTVTVTDTGSPAQSQSATVTVAVNDVNEAPVVGSQTISLAENSAAGTQVGVVAVTDPDFPFQALNFAITSGNTGGAFAVNSTGGLISVANPAALDFETTLSFVLGITVTDSGSPPLSSVATVTINLTDVNDPPLISAQSFNLNENSPNGTVVGTVVASDPDITGQTLSYAITAGNAGGAVAIDAASGQLTVANAAALDFETAPTITMTVLVTDNGSPAESSQATITINLSDVNDAPTLAAQSFTIDENSAAGTAVGTVAASDADLPAQTLTFAITGGNAGGAFAIDASTGAITVLDPAQLDFETASSHSLTVTATDNGSPPQNASATVTVNLNDVNDAPVIQSPAPFTVAENAANGTVVGSVSATDADQPAQNLTYSITAGDPGNVFAINSSTGEITVSDATQLDFETAAMYNLTVMVSDDGSPVLSASTSVVINVTDANDAPVIVDQTFAVDENSPNGTVVGTVAASDADVPAQSLTYAITAGDPGGAFAIDASTGQITVNNSVLLDFETTPTFSLTVSVTDDGTPSLVSSATITINLNDQPG